MDLPELLRDIADKYETLDAQLQSPAGKELLHATGDGIRSALMKWRTLLDCCLACDRD